VDTSKTRGLNTVLSLKMGFKTFFTFSLTDKEQRPVLRTVGSIEYQGRPKTKVSDELCRRLFNRAAASGDLETLRFMLANGWDASGRQAEALALAIDGNCESCALALIAAGADASVIDRDTKQTLLHRAALRSQADTCRALLRTRAVKIDAKNRQGSTALHCAAASGHMETIQVLLAAGASRKTKNEHKHTPLHIAQINNHPEAALLLDRKRDRERIGDNEEGARLMISGSIDPLAIRRSGSGS
jgi:ankyrin repeat protein